MHKFAASDSGYLQRLESVGIVVHAPEDSELARAITENTLSGLLPPASTAVERSVSPPFAHIQPSVPGNSRSFSKTPTRTPWTAKGEGSEKEAGNGSTSIIRFASPTEKMPGPAKAVKSPLHPARNKILQDMGRHQAAKQHEKVARVQGTVLRRRTASLQAQHKGGLQTVIVPPKIEAQSLSPERVTKAIKWLSEKHGAEEALRKKVISERQQDIDVLRSKIRQENVDLTKVSRSLVDQVGSSKVQEHLKGSLEKRTRSVDEAVFRSNRCLSDMQCLGTVEFVNTRKTRYSSTGRNPLDKRSDNIHKVFLKGRPDRVLTKRDEIEFDDPWLGRALTLPECMSAFANRRKEKRELMKRLMWGMVDAVLFKKIGGRTI